MTAVAAAAAAAAAAESPADFSHAFPTARYHPPYEDMIIRATEALNDRKGSTTQAISNYISGNYSGLSPTHPTLLTHHLERLISKGVVKKLNFSYKLAGGSRNSGRRKKPTAQPESAGAPAEPKKRGRPPKLLSLAAPIMKRKPGRPPKSAAVLPPALVYIISHDNRLHSDISQNFPGAAVIVLPKSLLKEKSANNSIIIFPNVIQSLIDASNCKRKPGRPKNVDIKETQIAKRKPGRPKKVVLALSQNPASCGDSQCKLMSPAAKVSGRPWKIRDMLVPRNLQTALTNGERIAIDELEAVKEVGELGISENVHGTEEAFRLNKRKSAGLPRKRPLIEGYPLA